MTTTQTPMAPKGAAVATAHTPQLVRGGNFRRWMTVILAAGVATMVVALAGRAIFTGDTAAVPSAQPSIRNLVEGIDKSFTGNGPAQAAALPSLHQLFPGIDGFATSTVSAPAAEAVTPEPGFAPHLLEGIDGSYAVTTAQVGPSAYTLYKLEQVRGDLAPVADAVTTAQVGPSAYTLYKLEQVRGDPAARAEPAGGE